MGEAGPELSPIGVGSAAVKSTAKPTGKLSSFLWSGISARALSSRIH